MFLNELLFDIVLYSLFFVFHFIDRKTEKTVKEQHKMNQNPKQYNPKQYKTKTNKSFRFIDLFSGIGGFHQAMSHLGGECVFASEIDAHAVKTYQLNYNMTPAGDIRKISKNDIPPYDVLCAGFPCQPFSKAGDQKGFADKTKGTLFFEIQRILEETKPNYFILENVWNLLSHDKGNAIKVIKEVLDGLGYCFEIFLISPHQLGVPQLRERVYILGVKKEKAEKPLSFTMPSACLCGDITQSPVLELSPSIKYKISEKEEKVLSCWDEFYQGIEEKVIGFPIWASEFRSKESLNDLPGWKRKFCIKNRNLYQNNKEFIDGWLYRHDNLEEFIPSFRKLEWQAGDSISSIWDGIVQFRPSGIRVKRPNVFPALVAMVQTPIVGKEKRRITPREAARLQSFPDTFLLPKEDNQAYRLLGNAINVKCVEFLAGQLFQQTNLL